MKMTSSNEIATPRATLGHQLISIDNDQKRMKNTQNKDSISTLEGK